MSSWAKAPTRFGKEPKEYTPGPGEYDAQAVSTTTKRGTGFGIGARMSINQTSEFAHLGPGAYATTGETSFCESNRRGTMLRSSAMDYSAAMKRLAASFAKVLPILNLCAYESALFMAQNAVQALTLGS